MPCMKFLYVRSDVCRRLLSDSNSRWTPLPLARELPLLGLTRDLHPLDNAHAEHTIKKGTFRSECAFIYNNVSNTQIILHHCCDPKSR